MAFTDKQFDERFGLGETLEVEFFPNSGDTSSVGNRASAYNSRYPLEAIIELATLILNAKKYYPWAWSFKITGKNGNLLHVYEGRSNA